MKMADKKTNKKARFSGNSKRAWLTSALVLCWAVGMFLIDLRAKGWQFELDLNIIDILIIALVVGRWLTVITVADGLQIRLFRTTNIPFDSITRLSILYNPVTGYIASVEHKPDTSRRPRRVSLFASFYRQPGVFLETLRAAMPDTVEIELADRYKREMQSGTA